MLIIFWLSQSIQNTISVCVCVYTYYNLCIVLELQGVFYTSTLVATNQHAHGRDSCSIECAYLITEMLETQIELNVFGELPNFRPLLSSTSPEKHFHRKVIRALNLMVRPILLHLVRLQ